MHIPSKRERYGVKLFMLCESQSAYLSKFIIYTGASTDYPPCVSDKLPKIFEDFKSPSKIVLSLMDNGYLAPDFNLPPRIVSTDTDSTKPDTNRPDSF